MMRLVTRSVSASTAIDNLSITENSETVAVEKIKELLPQIKQLKNCRLRFRTQRDGNISLTVDDITYQTIDD